MCYRRRIGRFYGDRSYFRPLNNTINVLILVEEACQGFCDDEEEEGGEGASLRDSGSKRERGAEEAVDVELARGWRGV